MKGADIHTVALILGHKDLRGAARYQHLCPAFLSDAVKLTDFRFEGVQGTKVCAKLISENRPAQEPRQRQLLLFARSGLSVNLVKLLGKHCSE